MTTIGSDAERSVEILKKLRHAFDLSSHVLKQYPTQVAEQLTGRLLLSPQMQIQEFLVRIRASKTSAWLRPLKQSLVSPESPLLRTLIGHSDGVGSVALTPDGRRAISASADLTLKVWDLQSGIELMTLADESNEKRGGPTQTLLVGTVAVTPDARYAISALYDRTPRVWDLSSGTVVRTLRGHDEAVRSISVTPNGTRVLTASADRTIKVWRLDSGSEIATLAGHRDEVRAVAITPNGRFVLSAADDRTVIMWDLSSHSKEHVFEGHTNLVSCVAVSPNGKSAVSGSADGTLRVWDLDRRCPCQVLRGHRGGWINSVVFIPQGHRVLSSARDATIKVWDLERGEAIRSLEGHTHLVGDVALTPDGRYAVSASNDRTLKVWDLNVQETSSLKGHNQLVSQISLAPDGKRAISGSWDGSAKVWDLRRGEELATLTVEIDEHLIRELPAAKNVCEVAFLPDGYRALLAPRDGTVRVWDLKRGEERFAFRSGLVTKLSVALKGRWVVTSAYQGKMVLWDLDLYQARELAVLQSRSDDISVALFVLSGKRLLTASRDKTLVLWNLERFASQSLIRWRRRIRTCLTGHKGRVRAVAITKDGRYAVSGSEDTTLRIWDLERKKHVATLEGHLLPVTAVSVGRTGELAVSGAVDGSLMLWRPPDEQHVELQRRTVTDRSPGNWSAYEPRLLGRHDDTVHTIMITCDGTRAVSSAADQTVKVWDLLAGKTIAMFSGESNISACVLAVDDATIIAGEDSGQIHILRLEG